MNNEESFALVSKMTTIRTLIKVVSVRQWYIFQLDVKNAFLNGFFQEKNLYGYMAPPPSVSHDFGYVYKLKKRLCGLKKAPHVCLRNSILWSLFLYLFSSSHDYALFVKNTNAGHVILSFYIDDMVFTNDDIDGILFLKTKLVSQFGLKDLGSLWYFLDIEVA